MLNISKPLSASQAQTYHAKEFTAAEQNYWKQGHTIQGEWHGKLAADFGLSGAVGAEEFARLSEGQHPETGKQLVSHRVVHEYRNDDGKMVSPVEHRAGWDATFSAPKSISLTALVGGDDRVREAHRDAVNAALNELEKYTQARIGGNAPAETTGKFAAAKFEHDTARPVDGYAAPQLHTHVVVFNMTERDNDTMRALQPHSLFQSQQFATAVYQSHLTYKLRSLGYEIEPGKSGAPEIKGYTQEYLDASSPRRQQIEEALSRSGFTGPEAAQIAAHNTRDKKVILSPDQILAAHQQIADEFGNQADRVVAEARERRKEQAQKKPVSERQQQVREAVTFARDKSFEREAVIDERALYVDALRRGMGEMTYPEIRATFEARVASGEFKEVPANAHEAGRRFTTAATIKAENEIVQKMRDGQSRSPQITSIESVVPLTESRPHFNAAQKRVVEEVLTSYDRVQGLQGRAGSGKTSVLATIREGAEKSGYAVEGFAPTSRAAKQLRDAGIKADTLQHFLAGGGLQAAGDPARKHLYMVDESSLASTQQMRDFLNKIAPQDKVLLIGDTRQHQGVDAGKPFEQLQEAGMRTAQLDQIMRQKDAALLKAVEHLSNNETALGVEMLSQQGRITQIEDPQERVAAIAKEYAAHPENTLIVSPDNASRRAINQAVRQELQTLGVVDKTDHSMRVLTPRNDMTGADREWAARYQPGDILHYVRGSKKHDIEARSYAQVVTTNPAENLVTVRKEGGQQVTYDPSRLRGIAAYREIEREFAIGDKVQFTAPQRDLQVANRDLGTIQEMNPAYAAALAALRARGGLSLNSHFDIISGSPLRQKRQLASEVVLKNLVSVGLVQTREIEGMGSCVVLGRSLDNISYRARKLRAVLMTEAVVLDAIRSWSGRLNLSSPNATRIRDEKPDPQFATFRFDLTGPSYLQPMVTYADSKPTPGFFVADVFLNVELNTDTVSAFLRKIAMLSGFRKARPFIPLLIAESFTLDALKLCRSKGIMATRPETLFGQDVARALEDLLHTLVNTATSSIERLEKIFSKLSAVEGAAGNLRGALFELVVGHCVHLLEGGDISLGHVLTELKTGKQAEVDVLWERQRRVTAYECKGYRSPVKLAEVEKWRNQKVPVIHGALKGQDRYSSSEFAFEFWTASTFEPDAEDFLQAAKQSTRRYCIGWKNGVEFRKYAQGLKAPGLRKLIDDNYFKDILAHVEHEKDAEAKRPRASQSRGDVVPNVQFLRGPSNLPDYSEEL